MPPGYDAGMKPPPTSCMLALLLCAAFWGSSLHGQTSATIAEPLEGWAQTPLWDSLVVEGADQPPEHVRTYPVQTRAGGRQ